MAIIIRGKRRDVLQRLREVPAVLAGNLPDRGDLAKTLLLVLGSDLLSKIQQAYATKSEGGTDDMGISWPPLSPVTLSLRRRGAKPGEKALYAKLQAELKKLPQARRNLIFRHYGSLRRLYTTAERGAMSDTEAATGRRYARFILEQMKPFMAKGRYAKVKKELSGPLPRDKAELLALVGAFALILRDTGRLFNSLSPKIDSPGRVLRIMPGAVSVGSNVKTTSGLPLLALHTSPAQRKLKKDGAPKLPRRQVLPDKERPIPPRWWADMKDQFKAALNTETLWQRYLRA